MATSAIDDVIAIESSSKPTAMKDNNQLIRRRKTKSAKSSDSGDGGGGDTSDVIPFIEDAPDDDASMSMSMSMPGGVDDPFIGLADSDASMSMPVIDSSSSESIEEEEEESAVAYGDTKDGATTDQWHALVSTLDATHESYTPPDATDTDASEEEDESDSTPPSSPWHDFLSTLDAIHESYTPPPAEAESIEDTDGEDNAAAASEEEEEMSMSNTASSMSMPPGDGREDNASDGGSSKARKLSTAHDTTNIHGRITKIGITRMKTKMNEDELPWGDDSDHSMSMSVPIRVSEVQYTAIATADTEEVPMMMHSMPNSKSGKGKTWKTKSAKFGKADDHQIMSMPHSKSGKTKSSKKL